MYDDSSYYGERICDEYDDKNNFMVPETSMGYFVYKVVGGVFDDIQDMISQFINDCDILSADASSLDKFWGVSYDLPRPTIGEAPDTRLLTDEEYRIYLYLSNCQLITVEDIIIAAGKCFNTEDKTVYINTLDEYLQTVDHPHYTSIEENGSNLHKRLDDDSDKYITNFEEDENTAAIAGRLSRTAGNQKVVNIPFQEWNPLFLEFLENIITVNRSVLIREYTI